MFFLKGTTFKKSDKIFNAVLTLFNGILTQGFCNEKPYLCLLMNIPFYKYHGAGNDFIMIDNRTHFFPENNTDGIQQICARNFGVGADGLILLEESTSADFKMRYFNADGSEGTLCGNGGRCTVAFACFLGICNKETHFEAVDGLHHAEIATNGLISLHMLDVNTVNLFENHVFLNTGSPHHVMLVNDLDNFPVVSKGREIRNTVYGTEGSNINFVTQVNDHTFQVRTYERGVENETLACGTGATAVAIAMHALKKTVKDTVELPVKGGLLSVSFTATNGTYTNIYLTGPAVAVFKGTFNL